MALLCSSRLSCDPREALTINSRCLHLASLKSTKTREKEFYMDQCYELQTGWPKNSTILINNTLQNYLQQVKIGKNCDKNRQNETYVNKVSRIISESLFSIGGYLEVTMDGPKKKICRDIQANWSESGWEMRCCYARRRSKKPSNCYVPANQWTEIEKDYNDPFHNCLPESYLLFPELAPLRQQRSHPQDYWMQFSYFCSGSSFSNLKKATVF